MTPLTHKEIFTHIYDKNIWGGSGGGSDPGNTVEYRALLQKFLKDRDIKTVLDWGCGDWAFSRYMDWSGIHYVGVDVVDSVIIRNRKKYEKWNIEFYTTTEDWPHLRRYDLVIVKDVLQHWSNSQIDLFFSDIFRTLNFKYLLITNTASQTADNQDIEDGDCRGLCARFEPLKKYNPVVLATIQTTILSEVLLITKE
jgi:cyclopropane fatty-acyl-phospholipid synthase-like methyltransferase